MLRINNGNLCRPYVLLENGHWEIFASKTFNIRKEVNRSFCFVVLILSCLKSPYNALQTLGHWLRHVCLCTVLFDMQGAFIPDLHTSIWRLFFYQLLSISPFPKRMAPKTSLQGPLGPSSKIFWLKHCIREFQLQNHLFYLKISCFQNWATTSWNFQWPFMESDGWFKSGMEPFASALNKYLHKTIQTHENVFLLQIKFDANQVLHKYSCNWNRGNRQHLLCKFNKRVSGF